MQSLQQVIDPIDQSAASIETAFLGAGDSLGRGLTTFEEFGSRLAAFSGELNAGAMNDASAALDGLSGKLILISGTLPEDAAILLDLVARNENIAARLDTLLRSIRMMAIVARSARIEAVLHDESAGLENFTQYVSKLTAAVQTEVSTCAAEHARLTSILRDVAKAQVELDTNFRERLLVLAQELADAFKVIKDRQSDAAKLIQDIVARSGQITQSVGMAMISLQSGDSTRQRLEHVSSGVASILALLGTEEIRGHGVPPEARAATAAALCQLQDAQLRDTVAFFSDDAASIDETLERLVLATAGLLDSYAATYGNTTNGSETFLATFKARLAAATDSLRTCEASRSYVERAAAELRVLLGGLSQTVANLNGISLDLVLVGMNAGLKASRLGSQGRSFIVVAEELKRLASEISSGAQALLRVSAEVQVASQRLDREGDAQGGAPLTDLDLEVDSLVEKLDAGDHKIIEFLALLEADTQGFDRELTRSRDDFRRAVSINGDLLEAAVALASAGEEIAGGATLTEGFELADALMQPVYTMARERAVHAEVAAAQADRDNDAASAEDEDRAGSRLEFAHAV